MVEAYITISGDAPGGITVYGDIDERIVRSDYPLK
jgi:hypothetical protein